MPGGGGTRPTATPGAPSTTRRTVPAALRTVPTAFLVGLLAALLAGCSSSATGATGATGAPTPAATSASPSSSASSGTSVTGADGTRSLGVSTPVPPQSATGGGGAAGAPPDPAATPARSARTGETQRHPFAPTAVTLTTRGAAPATAPVEWTDTTATGELGLPRDPGQVGWWQSGALAGDLYGSVVLAGHLDSRDQGVGFFARLLRVSVGDEVVLADGAYQQRYRVTSTRDVPKADLATGTDTFSQTGPGRLVLLTCTGPWDPVTHYPDNRVVAADPVGDPVAR